MNLKPREIEAFLKGPPAGVEVALIHGRDAGLVRERSKALEAAVLGKAEDPFRLVEMSESALKDEPGALYAEAAAISMLGGRKFVRVRTGVETAGAALEAYLAMREGGAAKPDALVVIEAGEIKNTQKLRKLAESSASCAVIACYPDSEEDLQSVIDRQMKEAGARLDPEAKALLLDRLGSDRGVSRQEIEKLLLYAGAGAGKSVQIGTDDILAVVGDSAAGELDHLIEAVLSGDLDATARLTQRLRHSAPPIRVLRALSQQLDRLAAAQSGSGGQSYGFFKSQAQTTERYKARWSKLTPRARALVLEAEINCKTTGQPAEAILERTLLQLARAARDVPVA